MSDNIPETEYQPVHDRPVDPYIDAPQSEVEELKQADDVVIDSSNFDQHFFDIRWNEPKDGQVMARFRGRAEFVDGQLKRDVVNILQRHERGGTAAQALLRKMACAIEPDSIKIPLQMASDLARGMSEDEVCAKPYDFNIECFYYTDPRNVPLDKHWQIIRLIGKPKEGGYTITSNVQEKIRELGLNNDNDDSLEEDYGLPRRDRDVGQEVGCGPGEVGEGDSAGTGSEPEGRQFLRTPDEPGPTGE